MKLFLSILFLLVIYICEAQNTMYFMDGLPQSIAFNPAIMPKMDFFIGLPGIGGVNTQLYNSGFNYNELEDFSNKLDNENYNPDEFVNSIGDYNLFTGEASVNLASFGFKLKESGFLSFSLAMNSLLINKSSSDIAYLLTDLDDISEKDFPIEIDGISLKGNAYMNFGITYSRKINEHLTLGITPRINFNMAGISTSDISFKVEKEETSVDDNNESDYSQTLSGEVFLGLPTKINPKAVDNGELIFDEGLLPENWTDDNSLSRMMKDKSLMVDIGATYEFEKWTFSASILNIGSSVYKTDGYFLSGNNDKVLVSSSEKVKISIPTKLYIGAMRQFSPKWNYALLFNNNFYSSGSVATATASLNGYIGRALSTSVSYTAGYKFNNLGIGLRIRFLQGSDLYFVTDNIIQAFNYKNAYRLTAALGINIAIGVKDKQYFTNVIPIDSTEK